MREEQREQENNGIFIFISFCRHELIRFVTGRQKVQCNSYFTIRQIFFKALAHYSHILVLLYKNAWSNNGLMKRLCKRASPPMAGKGAVKLSFSSIIASSVLQICKQTDDTVRSKWASKREWLFFISLGGDISLVPQFVQCQSTVLCLLVGMGK